MGKFVVKLNFSRALRSKESVKDDKNKRKPKDPTGTKRQKKYRDKWRNNEIMREANVARCASYRQSVTEKRKHDPKLDENIKKQERERKAKYRKKQKELKGANASRKKFSDLCETSKQTMKRIKRLQKAKERLMKKTTTQSTAKSPCTPAAVRKRAQRVREKLPQSPTKWASTVQHIIKNATPKKKTALAAIQKQKPKTET